MSLLDPDNLKLTDFMDLPTLQEIQDSFAAIAGVKATITDAQGNVITSNTPTREFLRRQLAIELADEAEGAPVPAGQAQQVRLGGVGPQREGSEYVAPIIVANQRLGTIRMARLTSGPHVDEAKLEQLGQRFGLDLKQIKILHSLLARARKTKSASIQFLFLLANAIARLCFQEFQLRQRIEELTAVYNLTMILSEARDLNKVLQRTVEVVAQLMDTKASSIRLIDSEHDELVIKAVHGLSDKYLGKGAILLSKAVVDAEALSPKGYGYVQNMATDPRVLFPQEAIDEGITSMLSVGMRYKGKPIGVLRVYTDTEIHFTQLKIDLIKSVAAQAAAAIENTRLLEETIAAETLERQVAMAADVQQRMIPQTPPSTEGLDLSAVYVPCFQLGGDFYDFLPLPDGNLGLAIADVSGKGVPASLIMASVRAFLRAQADNVYYLYEIVRRINLMVCRDTTPSEFVTLFYGVLDTRNNRFTYCNAGHPPAMLLRGGQVIELHSENMVLGVDPDQPYTQTFIDLQANDTLLLYTDGLPDAMNFQQETFGRQRLIDSFKRGGATADTVAQNILWDMRRFVGLTQRNDDVTMVVAKVK